MTDIFKEIPQGGGGWFKPADNVDALAIMIEVKGFDRQRPTPNGPKDSALCDVTVFMTEAALENGTPDTISVGQRIEQTVLARDLASLVNSATIVTVTQIEAKKAGQRPAWVWRPASGAAKAKVMAYYQVREAAVAAALESVPDFE